MSTYLSKLSNKLTPYPDESYIKMDVTVFQRLLYRYFIGNIICLSTGNSIWTRLDKQMVQR